jgi:predicted DNA-binding ArsR family transcriptional regulator
MPDFTLYDGDNGEYILAVLPTLEKERLIDIQMFFPEDDGKSNKEVHTTYKYEDVVQLRDYLSSIIRIYEKSRI